MDINLEIDRELYNAIEKNYNNESYSSAILDGMYLLTETIRNKTGLEGDGTNLVGQAFGGENPKIKINKLQTDSEKSIQKGIQEIMKGFYSAIRNPRSHDKLKDKKEDADAIIFFINYLLKTIDKSKLDFEKNSFLKRIFDEHFVQSKEYSDLLVTEIPKRQRIDIAITTILQRKNGNIYKLEYFMNSLLNTLKANEIERVYKVISEELMCTSSHKDIRTIFKICPGAYWSQVNKVVKIRIENILFEDVRNAKYDQENEMCMVSGSLGTWVTTEYLKNFEDLSFWIFILVEKLEGVDKTERDYVDRYYWNSICSLNYESIDKSLKYYISNGLKKKNQYIVEKLKRKIIYDDEHPWWEIFKEELKEFPEIKYKKFPF